jgi:hypothetical protein
MISTLPRHELKLSRIRSSLGKGIRRKARLAEGLTLNWPVSPPISGIETINMKKDAGCRTGAAMDGKIGVVRTAFAPLKGTRPCTVKHLAKPMLRPS